jgi:hypothetical protein
VPFLVRRAHEEPGPDFGPGIDAPLPEKGARIRTRTLPATC